MITILEPKISVIIPIYNVEKYLRKCLDSIINQSFTDIEIICINDGSTDNCLQILKEYANKDNRIIIISQENQGPGPARNRGLEIAKGEYISFIDPDDWVSLNFYESLYGEAKKFDCDIVKGRRVDVFTDKPVIKEVLPRVQRSKIITSNIFAFSWLSCIYKSELIKKYNIIFPNTKCYEDMAFLMAFLSVAEKYSISKQSIYNRFDRLNSLSTKVRKFDKAIEAFEAKMSAFDFLQHNNLTKKNYIKGMTFFARSFLCAINAFIDYGYEDKIPLIFTYVDKITNNLKYREAFINTDWYKILCLKNYSQDITTYYIKNKFKSLNLLQKLFYVGNCKKYKLLSILGFRFVFKRF